MADVELRISEEVGAGTETVEDYVPAAGKGFVIRVFYGSAAYNVNCVCKLFWKYGEAGEQLIWTIKGETRMPFQFIVPSSDVNGTSKVAISVENGGSGPVYMSTYAFIGVDE